MRKVRPRSSVPGNAPIGPALIVVGETGAMKVWTPDDVRTFENADSSREYAQRLVGAGFRLFTATKLNHVLVGLGARHFEATLSGRRLAKLRLDPGATIYGTREVVPPTDEGYAELRVLWDFCADHGAVLGSASWTSEQIWRKSIDRQLRFIDVSASRRTARGARKGFTVRGSVRDVDYVDIRSAYPWAMFQEPIPTRLEYDPSDSLDHPVGIALADIRVPDWLAVSPVYEITRFGMLWHSRSVRGWYPLRELRLAREVGCDVRPWIVYRGQGYTRPFDRWLGIMLDARELPGSAGALGKIIANSLWGAFAVSGPTRVVRFADDRGRKIASEVSRRPPPPGAPFIATEIAARVRERIFRELLPSDPVYVDTDGGMIRRGAPMPQPEGTGIGEWSIRDSFDRVEIVGMGAYAGFRPDGSTSVVLAGKEGISTVADIRRLGGDDDFSIADTSRSGFRGVRLRPREPWVWDDQGRPVMIDPGRWSVDELPDSWSVVPPELAGLGFEPRRVEDVRESSEPVFPIPF